jgi:hypothetical protein
MLADIMPLKILLLLNYLLVLKVGPTDFRVFLWRERKIVIFTYECYIAHYRTQEHRDIKKKLPKMNRLGC